MDYKIFIEKKKKHISNVGFQIDESILNPALFPFQKKIVQWALQKGRACLFEDCGLGKTIQQLEFAKQVIKHTKKPVLIIAPIAVSFQTINEGLKFGYKVNPCMCDADIRLGINITNYEKLHKFSNLNVFSGVVLDESSILKGFTGHYRNLIIESFKNTPYKLACTATPSPNDYVELGNHAEFLGVMSYVEMLSMFFINAGDDEEGGQWRLKKHAYEKDFWQWVASWAIVLSNPRSIGYEWMDLPLLNYKQLIIPYTGVKRQFFTEYANTMGERRAARSESVEARCTAIAELINQSNEQWVVWTGLNSESELCAKLINDSIEVAGKHDEQYRLKALQAFLNGSTKVLISKPSIVGFGMNWQHCCKMAFVGLSDSWESLYQSTRRVWRYGQTKPVDVYIIIEEREGKVLQNIIRKDKQAQHMTAMMEKLTLQFLDFNKKEKEKLCKEKQMTLLEWI